MGASVSVNAVDRAIKSSIEVALSVLHSCGTQFSGTNVIKVIKSKGVNISNLSQDIYIKYDMSCISSTDVQLKIDTEINDKFKQLATAVAQQFAFGSVANSNNINKSSLDLAQKITKEFKQNCINFLTTSNYFMIEESDNVKAIYVSQKSVVDNITRCIMNNKDVTDSKNKLVSEIDQSASSKIESFLGPVAMIIIAVIVLLALGALVFFKGASNPKTVATVVVVVLLIIGGLIAYYKFKK